MKLNKAAKLRLFGRITKWSSDKIRFNRKAINDLISCDGGGGGGGDIDPATIVSFETLLTKVYQKGGPNLTYDDFKQNGYTYDSKNLNQIIETLNTGSEHASYGLFLSTTDSGDNDNVVTLMIEIIRENDYKYIELNNNLFEIIEFDQYEYYKIYCDRMTIERYGGEQSTINVTIYNYLAPKFTTE